MTVQDEILAVLKEIRVNQEISLNNYDNLPLNEKWRYLYLSVINETLAPGAEKDVLNISNEVGWMMGAAMVSTSADVTLHVRTDDLLLEGSPQSLQDLGLYRPDPVIFYVSRFDASASIYAMQFSPVAKYPYTHNVRMWISNDGAVPAVVSGNAVRIALDYLRTKRT